MTARLLKALYVGVVMTLWAATAASGTDMSADEKAIRAALQSVTHAFAARDAAGTLAHFAEDVVIFDVPPPLASRGLAGSRKATQDFMDATEGPLICDYSDIHINVYGNGAAGYMFLRFAGQLKGGGSVDWLLRITQLYEKRDGKWWVVHEHASLPVDAATGKAVYQAQKSTQGGAEYSILKKE